MIQGFENELLTAKVRMTIPWLLTCIKNHASRYN